MTCKRCGGELYVVELGEVRLFLSTENGQILPPLYRWSTTDHNGLAYIEGVTESSMLNIGG